MPPSLLLAKVIGITYTISGIGMFVNHERFHKLLKEFSENEALAYLGGVMSVIIGSLIVTTHNVWDGTWQVVITFLGWMAMAKGVLYLVFPKAAKGMVNAFRGKYAVRLSATFALVLGLYFLKAAYM